MHNYIIKPKWVLFLFSLVAFSDLLLAQELKILTSGVNSSLRGLSVVSDQMVWCSGSNGMVAKTVDGGTNFRWIKVAGYETRDFRDIHGVDSSTAIIMAVDAPAVILKTVNGGASWVKVFEDSRAGMFLDAMHFNGMHGVVVGDPVAGKPFLAQTNDCGDSWTEISSSTACFQMQEGEAFFAASGSNVQLLNRDDQLRSLFVSGGIQSRIFYNETCQSLPLQSGKSYTGANGIAFSYRLKKGVVVGGDFSDPQRTDSAMVFFELGETLKIGQPLAIPTGYKSGVAFLENGDLVVCGTTGVDRWVEKNQTWVNISQQGFHSIQGSPNGSNTYLCGSRGSISKIISN